LDAQKQKTGHPQDRVQKVRPKDPQTHCVQRGKEVENCEKSTEDRLMNYQRTVFCIFAAILDGVLG